MLGAKKSMVLRRRVPFICHEGMMLVCALVSSLNIVFTFSHPSSVSACASASSSVTVTVTTNSSESSWISLMSALLYDLIHVKLCSTGFCKLIFFVFQTLSSILLVYCGVSRALTGASNLSRNPSACPTVPFLPCLCCIEWASWLLLTIAFSCI